MAKSKERSELEDLRARNKKLEKENRQLRNELGRHKKREHLYQDLEERVSEEEIEKGVEILKDLVKKLCPKCNKELKITDLGSRKLMQCTICTYRKTEK